MCLYIHYVYVIPFNINRILKTGKFLFLNDIMAYSNGGYDSWEVKKEGAEKAVGL